MNTRSNNHAAVVLTRGGVAVRLAPSGQIKVTVALEMAECEVGPEDAWFLNVLGIRGGDCDVAPGSQGVHTPRLFAWTTVRMGGNVL